MPIDPFHEAPTKNPPRRWKGALTGEWGSGHCVSWQISCDIFFSWIFVSLWLVVGLGPGHLGFELGCPLCNMFFFIRVILGMQTANPTISWLRDKRSRWLISWCPRFSPSFKGSLRLIQYDIYVNEPMANNHPRADWRVTPIPTSYQVLLWLPAAHVG